MNHSETPSLLIHSYVFYVTYHSGREIDIEILTTDSTTAWQMARDQLPMDYIADLKLIEVDGEGR